MKIPGPEVFENEWFALFDQYYEEFPEAKVAGVDEESIEILWKKHAKQQEIRMLEHASTLLKEWYSYRARSGDECELYDYDGSFLMNERGYPVQEWHISENHRIVDENENQIYYSNGKPILARKMSLELFEYLPKDWKPFRNATEEDMWY